MRRCDVHITRVLGMGMPAPKTQGCSYHCDTGLLPQKRKRDLNGEQSCTLTIIKEVYSSKCCPATFHLSTWLAWNLPLFRWNYLKHINNFCPTVVIRVLTTFQNTPNFLQFGLKCRKDNFVIIIILFQLLLRLQLTIYNLILKTN